MIYLQIGGLLFSDQLQFFDVKCYYLIVKVIVGICQDKQLISRPTVKQHRCSFMRRLTKSFYMLIVFFCNADFKNKNKTTKENVRDTNYQRYQYIVLLNRSSFDMAKGTREQLVAYSSMQYYQQVKQKKGARVWTRLWMFIEASIQHTKRKTHQIP